MLSKKGPDGNDGRKATFETDRELDDLGSILTELSEQDVTCSSCWRCIWEVGAWNKLLGLE
jgi:hypothetical protein